MPANLSPEYRDAETAFRKAGDSKERLECLRPFTVRAGDTVADVARLVHRDMALTLRFARIWGETHFDGQQVGRDQVVEDGDILELHA